jgi:purine-nucleoside phosphorylase
MDKMLDKVKESYAFLAGQGFDNASVGIVLGTGLEGLINKIKIEKQIPYNIVPHFPVSTVEFHKGQLICGFMGDNKVIAMQGRFHYYEGYSMQQITFPIRVMKELGIEYLLLSNAAGGINKRLKKGDLVLIKDHINLHPDNPLRGLNEPEFGNRFVDMSEPYNLKINKLLKKSAKKLNIKMLKGVYASVMGPNLETRAEYKYLRMIGADMVGMSTVPEVIVANQIGIKCAAISVITDECNPDNLQPVNIQEIIAVAGKADILLSAVFKNAIECFQFK